MDQIGRNIVTHPIQFKVVFANFMVFYAKLNDKNWEFRIRIEYFKAETN